MFVLLFIFLPSAGYCITKLEFVNIIYFLSLKHYPLDNSLTLEVKVFHQILLQKLNWKFLDVFSIETVASFFTDNFCDVSYRMLTSRGLC